jgi:hypothetical protein
MPSISLHKTATPELYNKAAKMKILYANLKEVNMF